MFANLLNAGSHSYWTVGMPTTTQLDEGTGGQNPAYVATQHEDDERLQAVMSHDYAVTGLDVGYNTLGGDFKLYVDFTFFSAGKT